VRFGRPLTPHQRQGARRARRCSQLRRQLADHHAAVVRRPRSDNTPVVLAGWALSALPPQLPFSFLPSRLLAPTELCARRLGPLECHCMLWFLLWTIDTGPRVHSRQVHMVNPEDRLDLSKA
jgi:hypothetical protein